MCFFSPSAHAHRAGLRVFFPSLPASHRACFTFSLHNQWVSYVSPEATRSIPYPCPLAGSFSALSPSRCATRRCIGAKTRIYLRCTNSTARTTFCSAGHGATHCVLAAREEKAVSTALLRIKGHQPRLHAARSFSRRICSTASW